MRTKTEQQQYNYNLFARVALREDLLQYNLQRGDIATIVDKHVGNNNKIGYSLEVFNALGETISVVVVSENQIEPLMKNEILHVRQLEAA